MRDGHNTGHLLSSAWEDAEGLLDTGANEDVECDAAFNMFLQKIKTPRTGAYEGSCKFLYERFGGKRGSWWIQQRGAMCRGLDKQTHTRCPAEGRMVLL